MDLLIDRADGVINICEMKFASSEYEIKESEERHARTRRELFKTLTGTKKAVHLTYVTTLIRQFAGREFGSPLHWNNCACVVVSDAAV